MIQDALGKAMEVWPSTGVPSNPTAWILQTARNRALDHTRRARLWEGKQAKLLPLVEDCLDPAAASDRGPVRGRGPGTASCESMFCLLPSGH